MNPITGVSPAQKTTGMNPMSSTLRACIHFLFCVWCQIHYFVRSMYTARSSSKYLRYLRYLAHRRRFGAHRVLEKGAAVYRYLCWPGARGVTQLLLHCSRPSRRCMRPPQEGGWGNWARWEHSSQTEGGNLHYESHLDHAWMVRSRSNQKLPVLGAGKI